MKTWNCQVKTKHELTVDLMFDEIMRLRNDAANLSTQLCELCDAIEISENTSPYVKEKVKKAIEFRASLK